MEYPKGHKHVVKELLDGKFVLPNDPLYQVIRENDEFYTKFFKESFDYELRTSNEYCFLISGESNEMLSRDMSRYMYFLRCALL